MVWLVDILVVLFSVLESRYLLCIVEEMMFVLMLVNLVLVSIGVIVWFDSRMLLLEYFVLFRFEVGLKLI